MMIGVCLLPCIIVAIAMTPAIRAEQMHPYKSFSVIIPTINSVDSSSNNSNFCLPPSSSYHNRIVVCVCVCVCIHLNLFDKIISR